MSAFTALPSSAPPPSASSSLRPSPTQRDLERRARQQAEWDMQQRRWAGLGEEEGQMGSGTGWAASHAGYAALPAYPTSASLSHQAALSLHQQRLKEECPSFPSPLSSRTLAKHSYMPVEDSCCGSCPSFLSSPFSALRASCCNIRAKYLWSLVLGSLLVLSVLLLFILLLSKNFSPHPRSSDEKDASSFRMQLLGQSILRVDVTPERGTQAGPPTLSLMRAEAWEEGWGKQLQADFVFSGVESAFTGSYGQAPTPTPSVPLIHTAPATTLDVLRGMGINVFACSTNNVPALGLRGLYNLFQALSERNMTCAGVGANRDEASKALAVLDRSAQKNIRWALLGMASGSISSDGVASAHRPGVNVLRMSEDGQLNREDLQVNFQALKAAVQSEGNDMVAVYHHNHYAETASTNHTEEADERRRRTDGAGEEEEHSEGGPDSEDHGAIPHWRRRLAHRMIDRGASMYVGHGLPYVQGIELYKGRPVFYGLGNFIYQAAAPTTSYWSPLSYEGIVAELEWGCETCVAPDVPVASAWGPLARAAKQVANQVEGWMEKAAKAAWPQADESPSSPSAPSSAPSTFSFPSDEALTDDELRIRAWLEQNPGATLTDNTAINLPQAAAAEPEKEVGGPIPRSPVDPAEPSDPAAAPASTPKCQCGYKLTSLRLRPIILVRPDTPFDFLPHSMQFSHSSGLPSFELPADRARSILQRVAELSKRWGTKMEIVEPVSQTRQEKKPEQEPADVPGDEVLQSSIYAKVILN